LKAIVQSKYGGTEVLQLKEIEKPFPKNDEVLIKVCAVSINDWDWGLIQGDFINRLLFGLFKPKKIIVGSDISGRIESVGKNVKKFKIGEAVYGDLSGTWGGFAEYACAPENSVALKPDSMSFEQAAAIPQAAMLAVQGLIDKGEIASRQITTGQNTSGQITSSQISPGQMANGQISSRQKLLINGAGGGVGTFALQIAKLYGLEITGVDSPAKLDMLRSIGFDHVIDYTKEDFTKNGQCYDLILDVKTNRSLFDYTRCLNPNGIYVTVGGSISRLLQAAILAPMISRLTKKQICIVALKPNKDLAYINELFEAGKLKPVIDGTFTLPEVPEAFRIFSKGEQKGKLVISVVT